MRETVDESKRGKQRQRQRLGEREQSDVVYYKTILLAVLISDVSAVDVDVDVLCRYSIAICYCKRKSVPNTRYVCCTGYYSEST